MNPYNERVNQDLHKIRELGKRTGGKVALVQTSGNPINKIELRLDYRTAPSDRYPRDVRTSTRVQIELLARYPFTAPNAVFTTPVFHPNVYTHGKICFGTKWIPTEGLDLLVKRIIQIITFDENILNADSPANSAALSWYRAAKIRHPGSFPTDQFEMEYQGQQPRINWGAR